MTTHSQRLKDLGLQLLLRKPVANYIPAKRSGILIFSSGQIPMREGELVCKGKVGTDLSVEDGKRAAEIAVPNAVAAVADVAGGIDNIASIIKVNVFVQSAPGFPNQPEVANGASDLLVGIFGDVGKHARAAVGVAELPLNAAVEVELVVELVVSGEGG